MCQRRDLVIGDPLATEPRLHHAVSPLIGRRVLEQTGQTERRRGVPRAHAGTERQGERRKLVAAGEEDRRIFEKTRRRAPRRVRRRAGRRNGREGGSSGGRSGAAAAATAFGTGDLVEGQTGEIVAAPDPIEILELVEDLENLEQAGGRDASASLEKHIGRRFQAGSRGEFFLRSITVHFRHHRYRSHEEHGARHREHGADPCL